MRYDGYQTDVPIAENIVGMAFEYFADPSPPFLLKSVTDPIGPWTNYGPKPPAVGVNVSSDNWGAGENCLFMVSSGAHVARTEMATPLGPVNGPLVKLSTAKLTDGPWCPDSVDSQPLRRRSAANPESPRHAARAGRSKVASRADRDALPSRRHGEGRGALHPRPGDLVRGHAAKSQFRTVRQMHMTSRSNVLGRSGREGERGAALVVALMATMLLSALGLALILTTTTETKITGNYTYAQEALYAADGAIERTVQDVLTVPDWNDMLSGAQRSAFVDGAPSGSRTLPNGAVIDLAEATNMINCGKLTTCSPTEMNTSTEDRPWGVNNPRYQLFAYGPANNFLDTGTTNSPFYVIVWVADDPAENDDDPTKDGNAATNKGTGRHPPARGSVGRPRGPQDYRSDADAHRLDRNRARLYGAARPGRTESPRPQGGGADTRRRADEKRTDGSVGVREIRIMSQMKYGRVVAGAMLLAAVLARPEAVSAQLDPLLMIKKGTPATPVKPNVIFAVDTSSRMQHDADETYYDPN